MVFRKFWSPKSTDKHSNLDIFTELTLFLHRKVTKRWRASTPDNLWANARGHGCFSSTEFQLSLYSVAALRKVQKENKESVCGEGARTVNPSWKLCIHTRVSDPRTFQVAFGQRGTYFLAKKLGGPNRKQTQECLHTFERLNFLK